MAKKLSPEESLKNEIRTSYQKEYFQQAKQGRHWAKKLGHFLLLGVAATGLVSAIGFGAIAALPMEAAVALAAVSVTGAVIIQKRSTAALKVKARNTVEEDIGNGALLTRFEEEILEGKRSILQSLRKLTGSFTAAADPATTIVDTAPEITQPSEKNAAPVPKK
jgi:hypothetical protein